MITDYTKQMELIKPHEFTKPIHVIGCGALGSWVAFFLLKMGFGNVHVYDFDTIEEHNLPNQNFEESQIGCLKVEAFASVYNRYFNDEGMERLTIHNEKLDEDGAAMLKGVVFSCVDSMKTRKMLYENAFKYGFAELWLEGRLGLWGAYKYALAKNADMLIEKYKKYEATLYDDTEAEVSACGVSQTALPSAVNCASLMIMDMIRWNNGELSLWKTEYQIPELIAMTA